MRLTPLFSRKNRECPEICVFGVGQPEIIDPVVFEKIRFFVLFDMNTTVGGIRKIHRKTVRLVFREPVVFR